MLAVASGNFPLAQLVERLDMVRIPSVEVDLSVTLVLGGGGVEGWWVVAILYGTIHLSYLTFMIMFSHFVGYFQCYK